MQELGTITGMEVAKNRDGKSDVRIARAILSDPEDVQSIELITPGGEDHVPEDRDILLVLKISEAYKLGLITDDQIEPDENLQPGEKEIYSKQSGVKLAKLKLNLQGELVLNDGTDFAVAFEKLRTEFNELQVKFNTHIHGGVAAGGQTSGVPTVLSTANIDNVKVEKVRL